MFVDREALFHRIGVLLGARFDLQFRCAGMGHVNEPINASFAVGLHLDWSSLSFHGFAFDNQAGHRQPFRIKFRCHPHGLVGIVVDDARDSDLIADHKEARRFQTHNQRLLRSR